MIYNYIVILEYMLCGILTYNKYNVCYIIIIRIRTRFYKFMKFSELFSLMV